ncbi:phosphotransferase [Actinospica robiniae]|uniref:phosphotransferase n=1 Tax=Actinospica robiniae TaxID=304901 RepID=UPI00146FACC2|nr:phosphotransferase [Actinospica robiniae]
MPHNEENAASGGVFRVPDNGGRSRILKIFRPPASPTTGPQAAATAWPTSAAPDHFNYWRREVEAYESGFAHSAFRDAGIRAPSLHSLDTRADGSIELWLEDVVGPSGFEVPTQRLGRFAHELGVGQARWAGRVPSSAELPWLSRGWLAQYLRHGPHATVDISDADWDDPAVRAWPAETRHSLRRLWESRSQALDAATACARTLCHLDLWPANLIEDSSGTSVLIDWAFVGEGAVGEDPANLIVDSVTDGLIDMASLPELAEAITDGYVKGLAEGGWAGSADETRAAIAACAVAKYSWLGAQVVASAANDRKGGTDPGRDDATFEAMERSKPLAQQLAQWSDAVLR